MGVFERFIAPDTQFSVIRCLYAPFVARMIHFFYFLKHLLTFVCAPIYIFVLSKVHFHGRGRHFSSEKTNKKISNTNNKMYAKSKIVASGACLCFALCLPLLQSCKDDYIYDDKEPDWLGANVYSYLESKGHFSSYLALADDLGYKDILSRTGSKTLFPADDDAFARYLRNNGYAGSGADFIHGLSLPEKRKLFNASVLNKTCLAYQLSDMLNVETGKVVSGEALRNAVTTSYLDNVNHMDVAELPQTAYWSRFGERGGLYIADNGSKMNLFLTPEFFTKAGLTESDWNIMTRGQNMPYDGVGFYVNNAHVTAADKDMTCKNGYLHITNELVTPLDNMAEILEHTPDMSVFSRLLNLYSAPYFDGDVDRTLKNDEAFKHITDSIFTRRYFSDDNTPRDPEDKLDMKDVYGTLYFDPANNNGSSTDMPVMFVPTNEAMMRYWNSAEGKFLRDSYGTWDNVPTMVLASFMKNHQRRSILSSLPHDWNIMTDETSYDMHVDADDVLKGFPASNGWVYMVDTVFAPIDYVCVCAPTLTAENTTVMNRALYDTDLKMYLYLRSLENKYNLLVPTDEAMKDYRDPITWANYLYDGSVTPEIWNFRLLDGAVVADVFESDANGVRGRFVRTLGASGDASGREKVQNRLRDIMDMHIVVADNAKEPLSAYLNDGVQFGLTKGGTVLATSGRDLSTTFSGGGDKELGLPEAQITEITTNPDEKAYFEQNNGRTFFIDRVLQDPFKSVYMTMKDNEDYAAFFELLNGDDASDVLALFERDEEVEAIFDEMKGTQSVGLGPVVTSFNNFRYTVLVPTASALEEAFRANPKLEACKWDKILRETNPVKQKEMCLYMLNFLRYHFIDGICPVSGVSFAQKEYETAARDANNKFVPVNVASSGSNLTFKVGTDGDEAHVVTSNPDNYNVLTRDYIVSGTDRKTAGNILASSRAVIHLIDHVLDYQK